MGLVNFLHDLPFCVRKRLIQSQTLKIPIFCTTNYEMKNSNPITNSHKELCHYVKCNNNNLSVTKIFSKYLNS